MISQLTGFTNGDTSQAPIYNNNSIDLFGLQVPQHFIVPNTQQWNLTAQRSLPGQWILEVGYVGSHSIHLRETRDAIQSVLATPADPLTVTGAGGQPFTITTTTVANGPARSIYQGLNGYSGFELFANDAYSHYHSAASHDFAPMGRGILPGRLYIRAINRRDLNRQHGFQHCLGQSGRH